jgi:hypothetical protein
MRGLIVDTEGLILEFLAGYKLAKGQVERANRCFYVYRDLKNGVERLETESDSTK